MHTLLRSSRIIDAINGKLGLLTGWLVLVTVLISAGNAIMRYGINWSSNAFLEIQWYLFAAIFLLGAAYTLQRNEHIRIDIIAGQLSRRSQVWIDIIGTVFFLLPITVLLAWLSWPMFVESFTRHEVSINAGGLLRWPVKLLVPAAFTLLTLQGLSELIKQIAFLRGLIPDPRESHSSAAELAALEPK